MPPPVIAAASTPAASASAPSSRRHRSSPPPAAPARRPSSRARPRRRDEAAPGARPAPEPSFIDSITSGNPIYLGLGVLGLLAVGYGAYRYTQRSKKDSGETSFLESRLQPDSFFGASGGQRIDTRDAAGSSSSMTYSLSQLDAIGDVDPVAEADVYLAYGRDLQAEEILKEAMRSNPERLAIRTKLLEVYAKRRDIKGFELLATQLFALTRGEGDDWAKAQELGAQIDPDNPMYRAGGAPERPLEGGEVAEPLGASTLPQSIIPVPSSFGSSMGESTHRDSAFDSIDLDLDNPDIGSPSRPAALDVTESIPPRPAADPAAFNATTLKMPLVANEAGSAPPTSATSRCRSTSPASRSTSTSRSRWPRIPARRRAASTMAATRSRASSSWPRSSSASATRTARATCCARCWRPRAARPRPRRRECSTGSAEARPARPEPGRVGAFRPP